MPGLSVPGRDSCTESKLSKLIYPVPWCTGSGLGGVIFLSSSYELLCFRFVTETVLVTHQCFSCCWTVLAQCQGLLFLAWPLLCSKAEGAPEVGRGYNWDSWPELTMMPYSIMLSNKKLEDSLSTVAVTWTLAGYHSAGRWWWTVAFVSLTFFFFFFLHLINSLWGFFFLLLLFHFSL